MEHIGHIRNVIETSQNYFAIFLSKTTFHLALLTSFGHYRLLKNVL